MSLFRHTAIYTLSKGIPGVLNFLALAVYTRLVSPADYGIYSITFSIIDFAGLVFFGWINLGYLRFAVPKSHNEFKAFETTIYFAFFFQILVVIFCVLFFSLFEVPFSIPQNLIPISLVLLLTQSFFLLNLDILRSKLQPGKYGIFNFLKAFLSLGFGILFITLGFGATGIILGLIIGSFVPSIWSSISCFKSLRFRNFNFTIYLRLLKYGTPLIATYILDSIIRNSDKILIGYFLGKDAAGLYSGGYNLASQMLMIFMSIINLAAYPIIIHVYEQGNEQKIAAQLRMTLILILGISMPVLTLLIVERVNITKIFIGADFQESTIFILPIVAIAIFLSGIRAFYTDLAFQLSKNTHLQFIVFLIAALINLSLNFILVPAYSILGAAYSALVAYGFALILSWVFGRKLIVLPLPYVDIGKILFAIFVLIFWLYGVDKYFVGFVGFGIKAFIGIAFYTILLIATNVAEIQTKIFPNIRKVS